MQKKKGNFWKDLLIIGAISAIGGMIDADREEKEQLNEESEELQDRVSALEEKLGMDDDEDYMDEI